MGITDPKKLYLFFGIFLLIGFYISVFIAFSQNSMHPYVVLAFGILMASFGAKGIYKTRQEKSKREK